MAWGCAIWEQPGKGRAALYSTECVWTFKGPGRIPLRHHWRLVFRFQLPTS